MAGLVIFFSIIINIFMNMNNIRQLGVSTIKIITKIKDKNAHIKFASPKRSEEIHTTHSPVDDPFEEIFSTAAWRFREISLTLFVAIHILFYLLPQFHMLGVREKFKL